MRQPTYLRILLVVGAIAVAVAACTSESGDEATTTTTLGTTSTTAVEVLPGSERSLGVTYQATSRPLADVAVGDEAAAWEAFTNANVITSLTVTSDEVWTAGLGGVVRWQSDATQSTTFLTQDGLPSSVATSIAAAPDGTIWAGSRFGASRFENGTWTTHRPDQRPINCAVVAADGGGNLWCGDPDATGVARFDGTGWAIVADADGEVPSGVSALGVAPDGALWVGTVSNGVYRLRENQWVEFGEEGPRGRVTSFAFEDDGGVWTATFGDGSFLFDGETWIQYTTADGLPDNRVWSMDVAPDGGAWAGVGGDSSAVRVARFDGETWSEFGTDTTLTGNPSAGGSVAVAENGVVWAGTTAGLFRLDENWENWSHRSIQGEGPARNLVTAVTTGSDGSLWVGSAAGLSQLTGSRWINVDSTDGLAADHVLSLATAPDGAVWAGTSAGLSTWDGTTWTSYTTGDGLPDPQITAVAVASDGRVWAGTPGGLATFDGTAWDTLATGAVTALAVDAADGVWVGSRGDNNLIRLADDQLSLHTVANDPPDEGQPVTDGITRCALHGRRVGVVLDVLGVHVGVVPEDGLGRGRPRGPTAIPGPRPD